MKFVNYAVLMLFVFSLPVFAQTVDKAVIATDMSAVDALVAKAAGDKTGAPVFIAEDGLISADVKAQLASLNIKTVILVGGPVVIKPAVADELAALNYNVIRLWGVERTGTAVEVAKFFWPEGSGCSVIVDDTRNSDDDAELQMPASVLASESGCPLIPVPKGVMPAEVMALLSDMNVSEVKIVAKTSPDTTQLAKFKLKAMVGRKEVELEVEKEVEAEHRGKNLKFVIVAVPDWRTAIGASGHPHGGSIVRFVSNVSQVPELAAKIKEKNITDVRVVGIPSLADEVAKALLDAGINATKVSGERADIIARKLVTEFKKEWAEKREKADETRLKIASKIREKLLERLNEAEEKLNEAEIELQSLKEDGAPEAKISEIQAKIDLAKTKIAGLKADVQANNVDVTNREMLKALESVRSGKWASRDEIKLRIRERFDDEERGIDDMDKSGDVSELEGKLAALKAKCSNTQALESLVERAKSMKAEFKKSVSANEFEKAGKLVVQAKRVVQSAKQMGNVCEKAAKISDKLANVAQKRVDKAKEIEDKVVKRVARAARTKVEDDTTTTSGLSTTTAPTATTAGTATTATLTTATATTVTATTA